MTAMVNRCDAVLNVFLDENRPISLGNYDYFNRKFQILWPLSTEIFTVENFHNSFKSTHCLDSIDIIKCEYEMRLFFFYFAGFIRLVWMRLCEIALEIPLTMLTFHVMIIRALEIAWRNFHEVSLLNPLNILST